MGQPAAVRGEHVTQVGHAVFQHPQPVDAAAKGEALPDLGVETAIAQDIGMDHAAAEDFQPVVSLTDFHLAT